MKRATQLPLSALLAPTLALLAAPIALAACGSEASTEEPSAEPDAGGGETPLDPDGGKPKPPPTNDGGTPVVPGTTNAQCSADFCWEAPMPSGNTLTAAWSTGSTNVWWIGERGTVLHDDGTKTVAVAVPTDKKLLSVGGTSASDVWVSGEGVLLHFDGKTWSQVSLTPIQSGNVRIDLRHILAVSPNEVWMRDYRRVVRWTGSKLETLFEYPAGKYVNALGRAPDGTIWMNANYKFQRWNGTAFVEAPGSVSQYATELQFTSPTDGWALMGSSGLRRWNGTTWSAVLGAPANLRSIAALGANDVWALDRDGLFHFDGTAWTPTKIATFETFVSSDNFLHAVGPKDVRLAGKGGVTYRWDGTTWKMITPLGDRDHRAVAAFAANDVWVGGYSSLSHFDGASWTRESSGALTQAVVLGPKLGYGIGGFSGVVRYDGTTWSEVLPGFSARGVAASGPDDVWAWGTSTLAKHWDGSTWSDVTLPSAPTTLWTPAKNYAWMAGTVSAVNGSPAMHRWDGQSWTLVPTPGGVGNAIAFGGSPSKVVMIDGSFGRAYWYNETNGTWAFNLSGNYTDLWTRAPNDIWAVGIGGQAAHWDGSTWTKPEVPTNLEVLGVGGFGKDIWLAGQNGAILRSR